MKHQFAIQCLNGVINDLNPESDTISGRSLKEQLENAQHRLQAIEQDIKYLEEAKARDLKLIEELKAAIEVLKADGENGDGDFKVA